VILSTKETKVGGFLGMFTRKKIEVIAAVEQAEKSKGSAPAEYKMKHSLPTAAVPKAYQRTAEISRSGSQTESLQVNNTTVDSVVSQQADSNRFAELLSQAAASQEIAAQPKSEDSLGQQLTAAPVSVRNEDTVIIADSVQSTDSSRPEQKESLSSRLGISESEQRVLEELKEMKEWIARLSRQNLE
ncbi:flagellar biosynthesis protein FlhF, partial [Rhodospirillum rubrum]|nr:flagellar biosynthesis protein FlhF [Rhodospirillum rubrum]